MPKKSPVRPLLNSLELAFNEGRKWVSEGGECPGNEEELYYILDELFLRQSAFWGSIIDVAGADSVDAAFYVGAKSYIKDHQ